MTGSVFDRKEMRVGCWVGRSEQLPVSLCVCVCVCVCVYVCMYVCIPWSTLAFMRIRLTPTPTPCFMMLVTYLSVHMHTHIHIHTYIVSLHDSHSDILFIIVVVIIIIIIIIITHKKYITSMFRSKLEYAEVRKMRKASISFYPNTPSFLPSFLPSSILFNNLYSVLILTHFFCHDPLNNFLIYFPLPYFTSSVHHALHFL